MARGTQHLRKRPQPDVAKSRTRGRRKPNELEETLFFERIRRGAKWVFVFLALVFGLGFVLFGVGSGSTGIGDVLRDNLNFFGNGSSGSSIDKLQKTTREHPNDAKAFRDLATALETKNRDEEAVSALERYTVLRPKDLDALQELAGLYETRASDLSQQAQKAQAEAVLVPRDDFVPQGSSPFAKAYADPNALGDPIQQAVSTLVSSKVSDLQQKYTAVETKAVSTYKRLAATNPRDALLQVQLAEAALRASDIPTAVAAYRKYLTLAPSGPDAARVKQILAQLTPKKTSTTKASASKPGKG